jgi:hypothetical protein
MLFVASVTLPGEELLLPRGSLAAAAYAVQARVERMLRAPSRARGVCCVTLMVAATLALALLPAALTAVTA